MWDRVLPPYWCFCCRVARERVATLSLRLCFIECEMNISMRSLACKMDKRMRTHCEHARLLAVRVEHLYHCGLGKCGLVGIVGPRMYVHVLHIL